MTDKCAMPYWRNTTARNIAKKRKLVLTAFIAGICSIVVLQNPIFSTHAQPPIPLSPEEFDPDFFFEGLDASCSLPCWNGLEPEISETQDLLRFLDSLGWDGDIQESRFRTQYQDWSVAQQFEFDGTDDHLLRTGSRRHSALDYVSPDDFEALKNSKNILSFKL